MAVASFHVDPQKGFSSHCPTELPVKDAQEIVDGLLLMRSLSDYSVVSKECHPSTAKWITNEPQKIATPIEAPTSSHYDVYWPPHCISGTAGSGLLPGLPALTEYDFVVWKGMEDDLHPYGACYHGLDDKLSTGVIEWLKCREVDTILVGGLALDYCVLQTAVQLVKTNLFPRVALCLFATKGVAPETSEKAIEQLRSLGVCILASGDELRSFLQG